MAEETTKRCPYCDEEIRAAAVRCKHCGMMLDGTGVAVDTRPPPPGMTATAIASGTIAPGAGPVAWTGVLPIPPETQIREYSSQKILGKGGMGEVYLAWHRFTEQHVAIKVLYRNLMRDEQGAKRFVEEARTMAGLRHPNIVQFMNFFEEQNTYFLVMEFVEGTTLDRVLRRGQLPISECLRISKGVLAGLEFAYSRPERVVHRDIKPANIMLSNDGRVLIADFGIAKAVGRERLIETRGIIGTVEYMSPEQVRGEDVSPATDVYAYGITLYKMLAGKVPFPQATDSGIDCMNAHLREPVPPMDKLGADVSPWLEAVVRRALAKSPADRFQTAGEMLKALEDGEAVSLPRTARDKAPMPDTMSGPTLDAGTPVPASVVSSTAPGIGTTPPTVRPSTAPGVKGSVSCDVEMDFSLPKPLLKRPGTWMALLAVPIVIALVLFAVGKGFIGSETKDDEKGKKGAKAAAGLPPDAGKVVPGMTADVGEQTEPDTKASMSREVALRPDSKTVADLRTEESVEQVRAGTDVSAVAEVVAPEPETGVELPSDMVRIPSGEYPVGCPEGSNRCYDDEKPGRTALVQSFGIMKHEVTVAEYSQCTAASACPKADDSKGCNARGDKNADHPINCVDWSGATAYCGYRGWRLPTEQEWEIAARGKEAYDYVWGNDAPTCIHTIMKEERKGGCGKNATWPGSSKGPDRSWCGAKDMGGSVREWVLSPYEPYPGGEVDAGVNGYVNRGGSWMMDKEDYSTVHTRLVDAVDERRPDLGFRCALTL